MPRVLITGSRDWPCYELAESVVNRLVAKHKGDLVIVHGDCPTGVDRAFREACEELGVDDERHPADWKAHGRGAGPRRNAEMVALGAIYCLAFSRDIAQSRGTSDCARRAQRAGIKVWLFADESGDMRPWQG